MRLPPVRPFWALVFAAGAAVPVFAQGTSDSGGSAATNVALKYRSTFEGYQRFTDEKVGSWREANDNVGRIGGWRAYAREASQPAAPAAGAPAAAPAPTGVTAPAVDPHAGHGKP